MIRNYQGTEAERGINFKLPGASFLFFFSSSFPRAHSRGESQGVCLVSAKLSWGPAGWRGGERERSHSVSAGSEKKEKRGRRKKKPISEAQRRESFKGKADGTISSWNFAANGFKSNVF